MHNVFAEKSEGIPVYTRAWWRKRDPHRVRHATCVVLALDPGMATPLMPQIVSNFPCCHQATGPPFHRPLLARPAVPFSLPRSLVRQLLPWASLASREGVASPDPPQDKAGRCTASAVSPRPRLRPPPYIPSPPSAIERIFKKPAPCFW